MKKILINYVVLVSILALAACYIGSSDARQARDNGVAVVLFAPNTRKDLDKYCTWPLDMLITDYPELGHCP